MSKTGHSETLFIFVYKAINKQSFAANIIHVRAREGLGINVANNHWLCVSKRTFDIVCKNSYKSTVLAKVRATKAELVEVTMSSTATKL